MGQPVERGPRCLWLGGGGTHRSGLQGQAVWGSSLFPVAMGCLPKGGGRGRGWTPSWVAVP